jgi:integrase
LIRSWIMETFADDARLRCLYRLIIELLWDGALRKGELLNLEASLMNWSDNVIQVKNKPERYESAWLHKNVGPLIKSGERVVHVSEQTMQWAYRWYTEYRPKEAILHGRGLLLCNVHPLRLGQPFSMESLRWLFQLLNRPKSEGGPGVDIPFHPHTLRHTWATMAIEDDVPLDTIQKYLGHASISSTQQYLHVADPKLRKDLREWREKHSYRYVGLDL